VWQPIYLSPGPRGRLQYMTVNGVRLHYVEAGKKGKPLIFFLHGFPEFWYSWRHQIRHFKKVDIFIMNIYIASVVGWDPDSVAVFPGMKLLGLIPNSYIRASVSDLYIPRIGLPIQLHQNRQTDPGNI
jgi:hypothetical protein